MNRNVLALLLRPAPGQNSVLALPVVAFAVVTMLVLTVIGGAQSLLGWTDEIAPLYQALAAIALVLLVVPLMSLGGAAARLSARRRDERLSTLRLLGVSPAGVTIATVAESVLVAAVGALAGVIGHVAISPSHRADPVPGRSTRVRSRGPSAAADRDRRRGRARTRSPPVPPSAFDASSSRPWACARARMCHRCTGFAPVIAAGAIAIAFVLIKVFPSVGGLLMTIVILAGLFAAALAVLNLVGPWVLKVSAGRQLRRAERPERLLAARIVLDSPTAAWRQVGGIAMASFMAVFAGTGVALLNMMSTADAAASDIALADDIRTGLIITLIGSF